MWVGVGECTVYNCPFLIFPNIKMSAKSNKIEPSEEFMVMWREEQAPKMFCRKGALRNFAKFTGKHLCQSLFFNKVAELAKFLRTPFLAEHLRTTAQTVIFK